MCVTLRICQAQLSTINQARVVRHKMEKLYPQFVDFDNKIMKYGEPCFMEQIS